MIIGVSEGVVRLQRTPGPCSCGRCQRTGGPHVFGFGAEGIDPASILSDALWAQDNSVDGRRVRVTVELVEEW